jgi:hypothetical protein
MEEWYIATTADLPAHERTLDENNMKSVAGRAGQSNRSTLDSSIIVDISSWQVIVAVVALFDVGFQVKPLSRHHQKQDLF